ncbi:hypothetical protein [Haloarchaeobius litoreus]|uniref:Uncharacterized protein n=1 Tax=Haloarchaeobius litoreus TaxID=755306 RepID=A0ABD6DIR7_9EURY|nr:hypothetical protein [Haloarchaeobius litoreus]
MAPASRTHSVDDPATLSPSLEPRPLTGETVTVDVDGRLLRAARSALGYLDDSDQTTETGACVVDAVRMRVESLTARLDAHPHDRFAARFDASDVVLLVSGMFGVARHYADAAEPLAADFHRERAGQLLNVLVEQRPDLVRNLRTVAGN